LLNALIGEFSLSHIDEFFQLLHASNQLEPEVVDGFEYLIESLDKFFDYLDDLENLDVQDVKIE
jgi:hypothetical protein